MHKVRRVGSGGVDFLLRAMEASFHAVRRLGNGVTDFLFQLKVERETCHL